MQLFAKSAFVASALMVASSAFAVLPTRFVGIFEHKLIQKDQLAKIDFIYDEEDVDVPKRLSAVVTLYFGDYDSKEYITYYYSRVEYNSLTNKFLFEQEDQDLKLTTVEFAADKLVLEARSDATAGLVGKFVVSPNAGIVPSRPLVAPVWGEYRGTCDFPYGTAAGHSSSFKLHLYSYRSPEATLRLGDPFQSYRIRGEVGEFFTNNLCGTGIACVFWQNSSRQLQFF